MTKQPSAILKTLIITAVTLMVSCGGPNQNLLSNSNQSSAPHNARLSAVRVPDSGYGVAYNFPGSVNAPINPTGALAEASGTIFGTTEFIDQPSGTGYGAIYSFNESTSTLAVLHRFDFYDGAFPGTGLIRAPASGNLFGTTEDGGTYSPHCFYGCGVIFKMASSGSTYTYSNLHSFSGGSADGIGPQGVPLRVNLVLYGTTNAGGGGCSSNDGCGVLYKINTDGSGYSVLYKFASGVAHLPTGPLVMSSSGKLVGTTMWGGSPSACAISHGCGTVFQINTDGTGFQILYSFGNSPDGADPESGIIISGVNYYGTTSGGGDTTCETTGYEGAQGCGVVFSLTPTIDGEYTEAVVHDFEPPSGKTYPLLPSGLTLGSGLLYGVTTRGGNCTAYSSAYGCGTVFSVTTGGSYTVLHNFAGHASDGANPQDNDSAGVVLDGSGNLWGNTFQGGSGHCNGNPYGCGTLWEYVETSAYRRGPGG